MQFWKTRLVAAFAIALVALGGAAPAREQTPVETAAHSFDEKGVPFLEIEGVGEQRHPAWIALYALAYDGKDVYDSSLAGLQDEKKFEACVQWLSSNLKSKPNGLWVWDYGFDSTYNDVSILAPWSSAFAQAVGIQAFLAAHQRYGGSQWLDLARKAAKALFIPVDQGGFLFQSGKECWFEEVPVPAENPSHILNGHMRVLIALKELAESTGDEEIKSWYLRGCGTLYRWLPHFDAGYALRYDLNPRKKDLLFRLANSYGLPNHALAVDKIVLRDPVSKAEVAVDVGAEGDNEGPQRVAGIGWGAPAQISGRTARRLIPAELEATPNQMGAPHSYFYLSLPGQWENNLRDKWYELEITYYDDGPANITTQMRAISPGPAFRDLRDGDLHLTGAGHWRRWIVPVRPTDLGYWVGQSYAEKHTAYLQQLAKWDPRFKAWAKTAASYSRLSLPPAINAASEVRPAPIEQLPNTPVVPILSMDREGVVLQHAADSHTRWYENGIFDPSGGQGTPSYSPYLVASQLLYGSALPGAATFGLKPETIERRPALNWLTNRINYRTVDGAAIYDYNFDNTYNDIPTKAPWPSAFGQAYILKSLLYADEEELSKNLERVISAAAGAYKVDVRDGGIQTTDRSGKTFFEEVPNATHVLNAHLASVNELAHASRRLQIANIKSLVNQGIATLRDKLHLFDSGYWLRYDQNPKKELLFRIDWLNGDQSPLIDKLYLENPQTGDYTIVDVGSGEDFEGSAGRISGADWRELKKLDGINARGFLGAGKTYLNLRLPETNWANYFDVPPHRLVIRYKDVSTGKFLLQSQSINSGENFIPLRGGVWHTTGDQQWKEIAFEIRPQDMGWFKGEDYQKYEVEQIDKIANLTNDWFFYQYAERHRHYLDMGESKNAIRLDNQYKEKNGVKLEFISGSPTYSGYSFLNSLDGDPNNNYTAGIEEDPSFVLLKCEHPITSGIITFIWESEANVPRQIAIRSINEAGETQEVLADATVYPGLRTSVSLKNKVPFERIRVDFKEFSGQPRVLLRCIQLREDENSTPIQDIKLSLVAASETYPEHGFENSLDGDPNNNYTAGIESDSAFVVLELSREAQLSSALIRWESDLNTATNVKVTKADSHGAPLEKLAESESSDGAMVYLPLSGDDKIKYLRFDFANFTGQQRALLREIGVFENTEHSDTSSVSLKKQQLPFLSGTDPKNPLRIFRIPISNKIKVLSDSLAQGTASEHETIIRFMEYINRFRVGVASDATPDALVTERIGACGTFANTLLALAAAKNIKGRVISLLNFPTDDGHAITELFVDGQWRVYDPTFGAYYISADNGDGSALSYDQIREGYKSKPGIIKIHASTYRSGMSNYTGKNIFLNANPSGVIGPENPFFFPLRLSFPEKSVLYSRDFGAKNQGANYIGAAATNQCQQWVLSGLKKGKEYYFHLQPSHIAGDLNLNDRVFKIQAKVLSGILIGPSEHVFDFSSGVIGPYSIKFRALSSEAIVEVSHFYRGPEYRYIAMQSYNLEYAQDK